MNMADSVSNFVYFAGGEKSESITTVCGNDSSNADINTWRAFCEISHPPTSANGDSFITGWQLPEKNGVFAEKDISQPISATGNTVTS